MFTLKPKQEVLPLYDAILIWLISRESYSCWVLSLYFLSLKVKSRSLVLTRSMMISDKFDGGGGETQICLISNPFKTCHNGSTISARVAFIPLVMCLLALFGPLLPFCQWRKKKCLLLVAQGDRLNKTCWPFHSLSPPSNPSLHLSVQPTVMDGTSISSSLAWQSKKVTKEIRGRNKKEKSQQAYCPLPPCGHHA